VHFERALRHMAGAEPECAIDARKSSPILKLANWKCSAGFPTGGNTDGEQDGVIAKASEPERRFAISCLIFDRQLTIKIVSYACIPGASQRG